MLSVFRPRFAGTVLGLILLASLAACGKSSPAPAPAPQTPAPSGQTGGQTQPSAPAGGQTQPAADTFPLRYPVNTIHIVVPYDAGGGVDLLARAVAQHLPKYLKASVVVDNAPGAGTRTAAAKFQKTAADGATLFMNAEPTTIIGQVLFDGQYDVKSWTPVYSFSSDTLFVAVQKNGKYKTLADLINAAKSGRVLFSSSGLGAAPHLQLKLMESKTGVKFTLVPFNGTAPAFNALIGGNAHFTFGNVQNYFQYEGIVGLAIADNQRDARIPDIATFKELGFAVPPVLTTRGVYAPPNLPDNIRATLEKAMSKLSADPEFKAFMEKAQFVPDLLDSNGHRKRVQETFDMVVEAAPLMQADMTK